MIKRAIHNRFFKKVVISFSVFFLVFGLFFAPQKAQAFSDVIGGPVAVIRKVTDYIKDNWKDKLKDMASRIFQSALQVSMNTLASDLGTWVGSGAKGQNPMFAQGYFTDLASNAGDAAFSEVLSMLPEKFGDQICNPSIDVKLKIGGFLVDHKIPTYEPKCSLKEMGNAWANEYDKWTSMTGADWLDSVADSMNPTGNDIGMSMTLFGVSSEEEMKAAKKIETQIVTERGWISDRNIAGVTLAVPESGPMQTQQAIRLQEQGFGKVTGQIMVDAANIFINQAGIAAFNRLITHIRDMASDLRNAEFENPYENPITNYEADPDAYSGESTIKESLRKILTVKTKEKTDYSILSDLMLCQGENTYSGPNNCIIGQSFGRAVENRNTLIEAIKNGYISDGMLFAEKGNYETTLNERSLMVLRKFRIVPVGWEEALVRISEKEKTHGGQYTIMDMVSCFDGQGTGGDEYSQFSKNFPIDKFGGNLSWCQGLVDPNWVLKAPLNYCAKQGYGGHVLSTEIISIPEAGDEPARDDILVIRSDTYCADERSCIKEANDGSCQFYGYCTEEKRTWNFNSDSCPSVYNTCESFTSVDGKKLALLKNTIDYNFCSADNSGCSIYSKNGGYDINNSAVNWSSAQSNLIYFNSKVESCPATAEGCNEFIRTKSGFGHNFIINGSFEEGDTWGGHSIYNGIGYEGTKAINIPSSSGFSSSSIVGPSGNFTRGETFTFSFYSTCNASSTVSVGAMTTPVIISPSSEFTYQSASYTYSDSAVGNIVPFSINPGAGGTCVIDQLKLEKGTVGTFYSDYRGNALTYFKTIPEYLKGICYVNYNNGDFRLKSNAPSACYKYARLCNFDELGCDLFKLRDGRSVAAKAMDKDYCPSSCVGYDVYIQKLTTFESDYPYRLIPSSAQKCSVNNVACTQFTNLEDVASGGEKIEYYSYLRQCIKPGDGTCSNFYSWEGSDESGYQLRSFSLASADSIPMLTSGILSSLGGSYKHMIDGVDVCSREIYKYSTSDPRYNPDCREFYTQSGDVIYALYTKTLSCSDNCKLFRMTDKNIDREINTPSECNALNVGGRRVAYWGQSSVANYDGEDENGLVCFHCLNGGIWDTNQNACLYKAIPGEGKPCPASENGCREYTGNSGNNIQILDSYDFETDSSGWVGDDLFSDELLDEISKAPINYIKAVSAATSLSSIEALENGGKSLKVNPNSAVGKNLGKVVERDKSYVVSFLAKTLSGVTSNLEISFVNSLGDVSKFEVINTSDGSVNSNIAVNGSSWQVYRANLENLDHDVLDDEMIVLKNNGSNTVNIDDLIISEITNKYYLIKNSWVTPNICYYNQVNEYKGVNYNLGCSSYTDRFNKNHNLRQFSKLCDSSAVGCELMVDTNNYTPKDKSIFVAGELNTSLTSCVGEDDCLEIPADKFSLVVYDQGKLCNSADKGCSLLGKATSNIYSSTASYLYQNVYVKNNPDKYQNILCEEGAIGCNSWNSDSGLSYFKDPMDNICQFNNDQWYAKKIKRCVDEVSVQVDGTSALDAPNPCSSDSDCSGDKVCKLDNTNYICPTDSLKTIGNDGSEIRQPSVGYDYVNWAGLCPINDSGCTEYIDPESSFNPNLILNPEFSDIDEDGRYFDGWNIVNAAGYELPTSSCSISSTGVISCDPTSSSYYFRQNNYFIEKNKLYIIKYNGLAEVKINCGNGVYRIDPSNSLEFTAATNGYILDNKDKKIIFYSGDNGEDNCSSTIKINHGSNVNNISIEWREAIVDYKLSGDLDFNTCSSANFNNGCVLFNERTVANSGYPNFVGFRYDSKNYSSPTPANDGDYKDANQIIKVAPDRVCGKWLSCYSYMTEKDEAGKDKNVCLQIGQCTSMDSSGNCLNFIKSPVGDRSFESAKDANISGYSLLNNYYFDSMTQEGASVFGPYDFEDDSSLGDWQRKETSSGTPSTPTTSCLVSKASDLKDENALSIIPVYPSPSNFKFIRVGGTLCKWRWTTVSPTLASTNTDYYLNFLVNAANFQLQSGATPTQVVAKVIGVKNDNTEEAGAEFRVDLGRKDWQRVTFKFTTGVSWVKGFKIALQPGDAEWVDNGWLYFDDIKVSPALKVSDSNYISPICRLYPKQDSVSCSSDAGGYGFVEQGWEGYCLQKDPANENVCLLWYPVDAVLGSGSDNLSSSFTGFASTGPKPVYCAQMDADFDLVEFRQTFIDNVHIMAEGTKGQAEDRTCSNCPTTSGYVSTKNVDGAVREIYNNCRSGLDNDWVKQCWCIEDPDTGDRLVTASVSVQSVAHFYCWDQNGAYCWDNGASCFTDYGNIYDTRVCNQSGRNLCYVNSHTSCYTNSSVENYMCFKDYGTSSWHKYNGSLNAGIETEKGVKLLVYNYSQAECNALSTVEGDQKWFPKGSSTGQCSATICTGNSTGACLMNLSDYIPKCSSLIQGTTPWADRLKVTTSSLYAYNSSLPVYFQYYKLNSSGSLGSYSPPFGAVNINSGSVPGITVFVNYTNDTNYPYYGLPYSCTSARTIRPGSSTTTYNACELLYYNANGEVMFSTSTSQTTKYKKYSDFPVTSVRNALKYIFASLIGADNYSHLKDGPSSAPACNTPTGNTGCPPRTNYNNGICSVYPEIKNIKISGPNGDLSQTETNSNVYAVAVAGFYTISFNTIVDKEQAPIKELAIKIKKTGDEWDDTSSIIVNGLDNKPNASDPHKLIRFLTPGNYIIAIKVKDNWGFYRCSGIAGFNGGANPCKTCCEGTTLDAASCSSCGSPYFAGALFYCPPTP